MDYTIRPMTLDDYEQAHALWCSADGVCMDEEDNREAIAIYLRRNEGLCFVATVDDKVIGTVLCGHEGRRGILRHLVVAPDRRDHGIAKALVARCLSALAAGGIRKCNTFVLDSNATGREFWKHLGWHPLEDDFRLMQTPTEPRG